MCEKLNFQQFTYNRRPKQNH